MARVEEKHGSRIGETRGIDGASGANRLFRVVAEESDLIVIGDGDSGILGTRFPDPFFLLTDVASGGLAELTIGVEYPWDISQFVRNYTIVDSQAPGNWLILVHYGRITVGPGAIGTTTEWVVSIRGATVTTEQLEEFPIEESALEGRSGGRVRGSKSSGPLSKPDTELGPNSKLHNDHRGLGTTIFELATNAADIEGAKFYGPKDIPLMETNRREDRRLNEDVPALAANFTRIAPNFDIGRNGIFIAQFMRAANRSSFLGADPGHVLCTDVAIDPIDAEVAGQRTPGRAYRIMVSFLWSADQWTPEERVTLWRLDDGSVQPVRWKENSPAHGAEAGDKVVERFRVKRTQDHNALFARLESG